MADQCLQLISTISEAGQLELSLRSGEVPQPKDDEVLVEIMAAPINPSDLALLTFPADLSQGVTRGSGSETVFSAPIPQSLMSAVKARIGVPLPVGNEGAGKVVAAGRSDAAQALIGKTVAAVGGAMYSQYRCLKAAAVIVLNEGTTPSEGASAFVNPMTALSMVETMRRDGFKGIVHTAAASNLGQMLNKVCLADGVPLVNVVRKSEHVELLKSQGAEHVVNSSNDNFKQELTAAVAATGAYLCFDAIGGGRIVSEVLACMEAAAAGEGGTIGPYGSDQFKQAYIYGGLDQNHTIINRNFGFRWSVSAWLLSPFLAEIGRERTSALQQRVVDEITTTFKSSYRAELSLVEALQAENVQAFGKQASGEKYLIDPSKS